MGSPPEIFPICWRRESVSLSRPSAQSTSTWSWSNVCISESPQKMKTKNETDCILLFVRYSSNFLASIQRLKWKNVWMCSGCLGRANYFRCKRAKVISLQVAKKKCSSLKSRATLVLKDIKIIRRNIFHPFLGAIIERQNNRFSHINRAHVYWKNKEEPAGCGRDWPLAVVTPSGMRSKVAL